MRCWVIPPKRRPDMRRLLVPALAALAVAGAAPVAATAATETITASVTTDNPTVDQPLTLAGTVSGAPGSVVVTATREDSAGTAPVTDSAMTDSQGNFTLTDSPGPPARGPVTYHLSADSGAATTDVQAQVAGKPTDLTVRSVPALGTVGHAVSVTAHLGSATSDRAVTIYARPYKRDRQEIDSGPVNADGNRTTTFTLARRTTFIAVFGGDTKYDPARDADVSRARAVLEENLRGGYGTSGGYRLYHQGSDPRLAVHMLPERDGRCLYFRAQHRSGGEWVKSAVSTCVRTDATGRAIGVLQGDHIVGTPYRLRAEWHGNRAIAARNGAWVKLLFRT